MPQHSGVRTLSFALLALAAPACGKDKLSGPPAGSEAVTKSDVKVDLPAVPAFDLPPAPGDGSHTVKELRVKGKRLLTPDGTEITVHGFVTFAYDCATAIRKPGESDKDVQDRIDSPEIIDRAAGKMKGDPTLCERAKFYIGDSKDTPAEKSLWVVDVPRPYNRQELKNVEKKDRNIWVDNKCEPNEKDPKRQICPPYQVGDEVTVTGLFKTSSPHSERNSDGLLVYKKMKNITQNNWESPEPPPNAMGSGAPAGPAGPPAGGRPSPEQLVHQHH